jgi:hypothetical protein
MALLEDIGEFAEGNVLPLAAGAAAVAVIVNPRVYNATARPLLKGTIKGFLIAKARVRALFMGIGRQMQQVYVEAKEEADARAPIIATTPEAPAMDESSPRRRPIRRTGGDEHVTT